MEIADRRWTIAIHGGAGVIEKSIDLQRKQTYFDGLSQAVDVGAAILAKGGSSMDAVEATVRNLEDNPLFNAGKGAVFSASGTHEMDASIMDGSNLQCGAVGCVTLIKNPISLARKVMERTSHIFLVGTGAEQFARNEGETFEKAEYFATQARLLQWQKATGAIQDSEVKMEGVHNADEDEKHPPDSDIGCTPKAKRYMGTVGAVALDQHGNLAAATSTGGTTNKLNGRLGDTPVIGAGTYANNATCAVSATGLGEQFIRHAVAHSISAIMEYGGKSLQEAADEVIFKKLDKGDGGIVAVDRQGNASLTFNSVGMFRGMANSKGEKEVKIWE